MQSYTKTGIMLLMLVLLITATGCVKLRPRAVTSEDVAEKKFSESFVSRDAVDSVSDWRELATEVAEKVKKAITDREDLAEKPIYMRPANDRAFATGFFSMLHTELVSRGLQVVVEKEKDMLILSYAALPSARVGQQIAVQQLAGAAAEDTLEDKTVFERFAGLFPNFEQDEERPLILSVGLSYNNRYVMHSSSVLHVDGARQGDFVSPYERAYQVKEFPCRTFKVSGE
ncbi:MAG: hypothetical protein MI749_00975 [Desulfovibrionales bacterium]|nr:hypothetical protein [Desulfovibrionales bacterium]